VLARAQHVLFRFLQAYTSNVCIRLEHEVWAIENCFFGIRSIDHKMMPILQTVWMAQQANSVKMQRNTEM
jgi:hypothetical protein